MLQFNAILHPTDFSSSSEYALSHAASLARAHGTRLVVLHVVATLGPELVTFGEAASTLEPEGYRQKLWDELRKVTSPDPNVPMEYLLAEGDPAATIARVSRELGCGLIVMGTHGRTGLSRLLMGSVAEQVMRDASCPVMIVKTPHPASS